MLEGEQGCGRLKTANNKEYHAEARVGLVEQPRRVLQPLSTQDKAVVVQHQVKVKVLAQSFLSGPTILTLCLAVPIFSFTVYLKIGESYETTL